MDELMNEPVAGETSREPRARGGRGRIARNSAFNLAGVLVPAAIAIVATPVLIQSLGTVGFGIFSIQIAVLILFGINDFGVARAVVLVAVERGGFFDLAAKAEVVRAGLHLSLALTVLVSFAGLAVLGVYAGLSGAEADVLWSWLLVLASCAFSLPSLPLRAALEIEERFGVLNVVRSFASSLLFLAPLCVVLFKPSLSAAAAAILVTRIILLAAYAKLAGRAVTGKFLAGVRVAVSEVRRSGTQQSTHLQLVRKGWWLGLAGSASTLLAYIDRFVLGMLLGASAVASYVVASELATKVWLVTGALIAAGTPRIAATQGETGNPNGTPLFRTLAAVIAVVCAAALVTMLIGGEVLLRFWIRDAYDPAMAHLLRILATGVAVNGLSQANYLMLLIAKRERPAAVLQFFWLPVTGIAVYAATHLYGPAGVAWVFTIRCCIDCLVIQRLMPTSATGERTGLGYRVLVTWIAAMLSAYATFSLWI